MDRLLDRKLIIVTGKGGVGKTTTAAALAFEATRSGKRVLVCEFDATGELFASLVPDSERRSTPPLAYRPRQVQPGLWAMTMDPEESLKEYLRLNLRIPFVSKVGALSRAFDFLANAAPGIREIVTIGKVAYEVRERHYDIVIVDATATGHVISQLDAARAINELVGVGAIRSQTSWIDDIVTDPATTGVVVVTTAHELPVNETISLISRLASIRCDLAAVVINRLLQSPLSESSDHQLSKLANPAPRRAFDAVVNDPTASANLIAAGRLSEALFRSESQHRSRLRNAIDSTAISEIPLFLNAQAGPELARRFGDHLNMAAGHPLKVRADNGSRG